MKYESELLKATFFEAVNGRGDENEKSSHENSYRTRQYYEI